jgi:hypothetical protein
MTDIDFSPGQHWVPTRHYGSLKSRRIRRTDAERVQYVTSNDSGLAPLIPRFDFETWVRVFHCRLDEPVAPPPQSRLDRLLGPVAYLASRAAAGARGRFSPATPSARDELEAFRESSEAPGSASLFHGTIAADPITRFRPLSHFGTRRAAGDVIDRKLEDLAVRRAMRREIGGPVVPWPDSAFFYEVELDTHNPWETRDLGSPDPMAVSNQIYRQFPEGPITQRLRAADERWRQARAAAKHGDILECAPCAARNQAKAQHAAVLREALAALGYDGLAYRNNVEDRNSRSLSNLHEDQVRIVRCWRFPIAPLMD